MTIEAPNKKVPIPKWLKLLIGGASGLMAICIVQPNDLLKTRMQLMGKEGAKTSTVSVASKIIKNEGFGGFYRGLSAALLRQATYSMSRFGIYHSLFDHYRRRYGTAPTLPYKILLGMTAGGCGSFVTTPTEVALIRMTADGRLPPEKRRNYKNVFNALGRIICEEGVTTLWRGASATITRAMVINAAQLGSYIQCREWLLPSMSGGGMSLHFAASMIAGVITSVCSLPVDIVKTRVQNSTKRMSQFTVLKDVIKKEGVMTLWSGFLPNCFKIGPHTVLTFIFLEQLSALYYTIYP